jgi:hypothetical protein
MAKRKHHGNFNTRLEKCTQRETYSFHLGTAVFWNEEYLPATREPGLEMARPVSSRLLATSYGTLSVIWCLGRCMDIGTDGCLFLIDMRNVLPI